MINVEAVAQYLAATTNGNTQDNALIQQLMGIAGAQATGFAGDPGSVAAAAAALRSGGSAAQGVVEVATIGSQPGLALSMGYGMTPEQEIEALAEGIKMFVQRYPIDPRCYEFLTTSSSTVIARVLRDFRAPREGDTDYSRLVTTYIRRVRADAEQSGLSAVGGPNNPLASVAVADIAAGPDVCYDAEVSEFLNRYPCDERARDLLQKAPANVQRRVLTEFRPKQQGDSDYSPLLTTFTQKCIHQQAAAQNQALGGGGGFQSFQQMRPQPLFQVGEPILQAPAPADLAAAMVTPGLDAFLAKYPVDERAYDFFACSSQQVQEKVLREFRPKAEGEASYAGLFTSFVRKVRQLFEGGGPMPGMGGGMGGKGAGGGFMPAQQFAGHGVQHVTRADAGFRPMVTPNMSWAFEESDPYAAPPDIESFRLKFPMDDRAFDFLQNVDLRVQKRVVETFQPPRPTDPDFSAGITAYIKSLKRMLQEVQAETTLTQEAVDLFFSKYPCDQRATEYFNMCSREVQAACLRDFRPRQEGDSDYSASMTAYIKRCRAWAEPRQEQQAQQAPQQFAQQAQQQQFVTQKQFVVQQVPQQFAPQQQFVQQHFVPVAPQQGVQLPPGHVPVVVLPRSMQQQVPGAWDELENPAKRMRW